MTRRPRILLIDDDPMIANGITLLLEPEGIDVTWRLSPIALPLEMKEINPDLILLDLGMPALSGVALLAAGPRRILRTDAPIVLFSGRSRDELSRLTEMYDVAGFIAKRADIGDIITDIRLMLQHAQNMKGANDDAIATASAAA
jgi:DNA-binding response OmpR family regulator